MKRQIEKLCLILQQTTGKIKYMKTCSKCKIEKEEGEFYINPAGKLRSECSTCAYKWRKTYRQNNKDRISQEMKLYNKTHKAEKKAYLEKYKDKVKIQRKEHYQNNKDANKIYSKEYYIKNKNKIDKRNKDYVSNNKDKIKEREQKRTYGISWKNTIIEQDFKCKICGRNFDLSATRCIHTDHNHTTKAFRGILCDTCNNILKGQTRDKDVSIFILENSIKYLQKNETTLKYYNNWKYNNKSNYQNLLNICEYHCEICNLELTRELKKTSENSYIFPNIDHNKTTGMIRGILCRKCNLRLGNAKDDINILTGSIDYLFNHAHLTQEEIHV